jgi:protein Mpv17
LGVTSSHGGIKEANFMFDHETPKPPLRHRKCEKDCDDFLRISLDLILETWDDSFNLKGSIPMLATYETLLARRPIALKTLLSGTCACLGDTAAQYGEYLRGQHCPAPPAASPSHGALAAPFAVDRQRTGAFTSLAAFWNGPLLHVHFNNLERWFPQRIGLRSVVSKTMVNQIVWNPFVWLPVFYMWTGFAYWRTLDEIITKARREYWTSLKATWIVFTPVNLANFYFVPVRHQVTTNVAVSFVYSLTLSFLAAPRASDNAFVDGSAR